MSKLNIHSSHPLIPYPEISESQSHFVSISSQDRNLKKNPVSNDFVITLPQEYRNVESVNLSSSYFPIVDDQYSIEQNNVDLCFRFKKAFNPLDVSGCTFTDANIFAFVSENVLNNSYFRIRIRNGRYSETELMNEIQNKMNELITDKIAERIYGTSRIQYWGDYKFEIGYFQNSNIFLDFPPYIASDYTTLYYNSSKYGSIEEAIDAFNAKFGTNIEKAINGTTTPTQIILSSDEINSYALTATALDPAILLTWKSNLNSVLENYLQNNSIFGLFIQGSSDGWIAPSTEARAFFIGGAGYDHFKIVIDKVTTKFNIANIADEFEIITDKDNYYSVEVLNIINSISNQFDSNTYQSNLNTAFFMPRKTGECSDIEYYVDDLKWGLPVYMGLTGQEVIQEYKWDTGVFRSIPGYNLPTYHYYPKGSEEYQPFKRKTNGYAEASIFVLVPTYQLDVKGEPYFFLDMDTMNCIDEIAPYKDNTYSSVNNISSGKTSSAFAKLPLSILDTVVYGGSQPMTKEYSPPLSRLSKISIRLRFHNGRPVKFGVQPFSFVLEIKTSKMSIMKPK